MRNSPEELLATTRHVAEAFVRDHYPQEEPFFEAAWKAFTEWMKQLDGTEPERSPTEALSIQMQGALGFVGDEVLDLVTPVVLGTVAQTILQSQGKSASVEDLQRMARKAALAFGATGQLLNALAENIPRLYVETRSGSPSQTDVGEPRGRVEGTPVVTTEDREAELKRLKGQIKKVARVKRRDPFVRLIIGNSPAALNLMRQIEDLKDSRGTVLIRGESGVGKELVAQAIHKSSPRRRGPFVVAHLAHLPETMIETELFGHEKGAFTDAKTQRKGLFELAHGGTIFLDEVGDLGAACQIRLLRVLESREFRRLSGTEPIPVDVRIITATDKDLETAVREGRFREQLYYRLYVCCIHVPALRERKEDIPALVEHFASTCFEQMGREKKHFSEEALSKLLLYDWPGNVRELGNCVERAIVRARGDAIEAGDIEFVPLAAKHDVLTREDSERHSIIKALESSKTVKDALRRLGLPKSTFYDKCKRYGMEPKRHLGQRL